MKLPIVTLSVLIAIIAVSIIEAHIVETRDKSQDARVDSDFDVKKQRARRNAEKKSIEEKRASEKRLVEEEKMEKKAELHRSPEKTKMMKEARDAAVLRAERKVLEESRRIEKKLRLKSTDGMTDELKSMNHKASKKRGGSKKSLNEEKRENRSKRSAEKESHHKAKLLKEKRRLLKKYSKKEPETIFKHAQFYMKEGKTLEEKRALKELKMRFKRGLYEGNFPTVQTKALLHSRKRRSPGALSSVGLDGKNSDEDSDYWSFERSVDFKDADSVGGELLEDDLDIFGTPEIPPSTFPQEQDAIEAAIQEDLDNFIMPALAGDSNASPQDVIAHFEDAIQHLSAEESSGAPLADLRGTEYGHVSSSENLIDSEYDQRGPSYNVVDESAAQDEVGDIIESIEEEGVASGHGPTEVSFDLLPLPVESEEENEISDEQLPPSSINRPLHPWDIPQAGAERCGQTNFGPENRRQRTRRMVKILEGKEALPGSFPWQVALLDSDRDLLCGGSLIAPRWVMTAAHCIRKKLFVRLSEHHLHNKDGFEIEQKVLRMFRHPEFNRTTIDNDIALLRLPRLPAFPDNSTGRMSRGITDRACMPTSLDDFPPVGTRCLVMGWGKASTSHSFGTDSLMYTRLPIISRKACVRANRKTITENMFCAGHYKGGSDTCSGDSGGPLLCNTGTSSSDESWTVYGVTSFGDGCGVAGKMGVYAKVNNYLDWISEIMSRYL